MYRGEAILCYATYRAINQILIVIRISLVANDITILSVIIASNLERNDRFLFREKIDACRLSYNLRTGVKRRE